MVQQIKPIAQLLHELESMAEHLDKPAQHQKLPEHKGQEHPAVKSLQKAETECKRLKGELGQNKVILQNLAKLLGQAQNDPSTYKAALTAIGSGDRFLNYKIQHEGSAENRLDNIAATLERFPDTNYQGQLITHVVKAGTQLLAREQGLKENIKPIKVALKENQHETVKQLAPTFVNDLQEAISVLHEMEEDLKALV